MKPPKPFEKKIIASPEDFLSIRDDLKVIGAFNPGVTTIKTPEGLETILYVRIAEATRKKTPGKTLLPFFRVENREGSTPELDYDIVDNRRIKNGKKSVILKQGHTRLKHISLPRMVILDKDRNVAEIKQEPIIYPTWEYERFGLEDVRITHLEDGRYVITYATPHREFGVRSHILVTNDIKNLKNLERVTSENTPRPEIRGKDFAVFPNKVPSPSTTEILKKGQPIYAAHTRPSEFNDISTPGIWISYSPDLVHWGQDHRLTTSEKGEVTGTGSSPVKRPHGWLEAFHETTRNKKGETKYVTRLMTLNLEAPWKVSNITPVFLKREDFRELLPKEGYVPDTVFTTGMVVDKGRTDFYQGIDDQWTTLASFYNEDVDKFARAK